MTMTLPAGPTLSPGLQTFLWMATPVPFIEDCRRRYGDTIRLNFAQMGPTIFCSSPDAIRAIFSATADDVHGGEGNRVLRPIVGRGSMLILDGAAHLRHRRLLMPPFHGPRMTVYVDIIRELTEASLREWPVGRGFSARPRLKEIVLRAILRAVFGLAYGEDSDRLASVLGQYAELGNAKLIFFPKLQRDWGPLSPWGRVVRLRAETDRLFFAEIAKRKQSANEDRDDVLSLLLGARDEDGRPLSDEELRDELITLLLAGHETTATALEWALERLAHEPTVLEELCSELRRVVGTDRLKAEHLPKMPYLDGVIKEVLRLRPVIPNVSRRLLAPMTIDGYELPTGMFVAPCIYLAHRRADTYPNPTQFDPTRWLDRKPDPYTWLPFGGGVRRCIGMAFAIMEMKVILATIFGHRRLRTSERRRAARVGRRGITLSPRGFQTVFDHATR